MSRIDSFTGGFRFLSNFYPSKVYASWNEEKVETNSVENSYQAMKAINRGDFDMVCIAKTPGQAKRIGRKITMRSDWETIKLGVMEDLLRQKFSDPMLRQQLLDTKSYELIEGNSWGDKYYGCVLENDEWVGQNHLGKLLMKLREELRGTSGE